MKTIKLYQYADKYIAWFRDSDTIGESSLKTYHYDGISPDTVRKIFSVRNPDCEVSLHV